MPKNYFLCDCEAIHPEAVAKAISSIPKPNVLANLAHFYKILSEPTRLKICLALANQELCVCDLANVLSMSKSSISHQLRRLREANIVYARPSGKEVYYSLDDAHVQEAIGLSLTHIKHQPEEKYDKTR